VDSVSEAVGIAATDYTLKLAVFHTVFNVLGVVLMTPVMGRLVALVERVVPPPSRDVSRPRFLNNAVVEFPATVIEALRNEVQRLYDHATEIIAHGLNLHRSRIMGAGDLDKVVADSRRVIEFDLDERYEVRVKSLHSAIVEFTTRTSQSLHGKDVETAYRLRDISGRIVESVKAIKHLRKNVNRFTTRNTGLMRDLYNEMRMEIAEILREIDRLQHADPADRTTLWLDEARAGLEDDRRTIDRRVDTLIRDNKITAEQATSFLNDFGYAFSAMRNLIDVARELYAAPEAALAEIERMISLEDEDLGQVMERAPDAGVARRSGSG
jgi:phosphate:Na+ symporter